MVRFGIYFAGKFDRFAGRLRFNMEGREGGIKDDS